MLRLIAFCIAETQAIAGMLFFVGGITVLAPIRPQPELAGRFNFDASATARVAVAEVVALHSGRATAVAQRPILQQRSAVSAKDGLRVGDDNQSAEAPPNHLDLVHNRSDRKRAGTMARPV
jgi:hypothetical protein